jgi:DNA repair protein SbcD/Mre11
VGWEGLVEAAVVEGVSALLLAGDVVDRDNRYFEAYGPLVRGVARLAEAGIPVVAVAGNHDSHTLHEVGAGSGLVVLGRGGRWERWTLTSPAGDPVLHVDGWSFPTPHHSGDPAAAYDLHVPSDGAPVVGLLHCDLDVPGSRYAPVSRASLARCPVIAWVLGHVHAPSLREAPGAVPVLQAGSLTALDPGETGRRGAWLLEVGEEEAPRFRPLPLSRVRYEGVEVEVDGVVDEDGLRARVVAALSERLDGVVGEGVGPLEVVSCRVRLSGRSSLGPALAALQRELPDLDLADREGVRLVVERVEVDTRPAVDLEALAQGSGAPALLARIILGLEDDEALRWAAERAAGAVAGRSHYAALSARREEDGVGAVVVVEPSELVGGGLRRQAARLLDELLRQKGVEA